MESSSSTYTYSRRPTEVALRTDSTFIMTNTNDPCWFLGNVPFPTGTEVVAFFGIFMHPAIVFVALDYWIHGSTEKVRTWALLLFATNAILIASNYLLIMGAKFEKRWLCCIWIGFAALSGIEDIGVCFWLYNQLYFVLFHLLSLTITMYKVWVVITFVLALNPHMHQMEIPALRTTAITPSYRIQEIIQEIRIRVPEVKITE